MSRQCKGRREVGDTQRASAASAAVRDLNLKKKHDAFQGYVRFCNQQRQTWNKLRAWLEQRPCGDKVNCKLLINFKLLIKHFPKKERFLQRLFFFLNLYILLWFLKKSLQNLYKIINNNKDDDAAAAGAAAAAAECFLSLAIGPRQVVLVVGVVMWGEGRKLSIVSSSARLLLVQIWRHLQIILLLIIIN